MKTVRMTTLIALAILGMVLFTACGANTAVHTTNPDAETPTVTATVPATTVQEFGTVEEIPQATEVIEPTVADYEEDLEQMAYDDLWIGFGSHATTMRVEGKTAYINHANDDLGWSLNAMFPEKKFLEEHTVTFSFEGEGALERYTPPVLEEDQLQGDDYGVATTEMIATRIAIRGFGDGVLTIVVDDEFTLIVNDSRGLSD